MPNKAFLKLGDHPIIDFCNTLVCHGKVVEDRLLDPKDAENFITEFYSIKIKVDSNAFNSLIKLRGLLRQYFYFILDLQSTDPIPELNRWYAQHPLVLTFSGQNPPEFKAVEGQSFITPMTSSLNSFLKDIEHNRLKKCANPNCSHLFYDISRNNKRQWCSMNSCGNIMKARAFYARKKGINKK